MDLDYGSPFFRQTEIMRIGFDISQTGINKAGCGIVAFSLINELTKIDRENSYLLYSNFGPDFWDPNHKKATFKKKQDNVKKLFSELTHAQARSFWGSHSTDFEIRLGNPDIVHSNNFYCPTGLAKAKLVYTLYDLSFLESPEFTTEENRLVCFEGVFKASLYADIIISISEYSKYHFLETFPHFPSERIRVLHPASRFSLKDGVNDNPGRISELLPNGFWLCVGTLEPRKNIRRLLAAYSKLIHSSSSAFPLAIAGGKGWLEDGLIEYLACLGLRENREVYFLGYVTDLQLRWLYRHCFAFIYPSLFEGFGVPVLEAMSLGAAVITSNRTSLPEICGDAAIMVDPENVEGLAESMIQLYQNENLRGDLQNRAIFRAEFFSWEKMARGVLEVYRNLLSPTRLTTFSGEHNER